MLHIEQAFKVINDTAKKQTETTEKINTAIEKLQEQTVRTAQRTAILKTSCRDSLVNGNWQLASANLFTPLKAKLRD
jgi:methyl-accepting chemotaxis protein